ncbi:hypothetical protein ACO0K9_14105 [Undibacterium sp. Ji50W]
MPRRRQIKSIAAGIADSFNSRNNDLEGYWTIGKLCRFAHAHTTSLLALNLLNIICAPANTEFNAVMHDYKVKLRVIMNKQGIPEDWLKAAIIEIDFQPDYEAYLHYFRSALGSPYTVTAKLMTDQGKIYSARTGGNCKPHDPLRETRRSV